MSVLKKDIVIRWDVPLSALGIFLVIMSWESAEKVEDFGDLFRFVTFGVGGVVCLCSAAVISTLWAISKRGG